jgi:hypothetical protein
MWAAFMRATPRLIWTLAATLTASGCSFAAVYGPPASTKPSVDVSCTEERYAPALDVGAMGGQLIYAAAGDIDKDIRLAAVLGAVLYGGSAIYGYLNTLDCARAKDAAHRYHTKLLLRQIDLLNEAASQGGDSSSAPPEETTPAPAPPEQPTSPVQ